jgi:hypothetical protein
VPPNSESRVHKEGSSMPHVHGTLHITYTVPLTSDRKEDRAATRPSPPLTGRPASAGRKRTSRGMHTTRRRASISASGQPRQDLGTEPRPCRLYHSCMFVSAAAATTVPSSVHGVDRIDPELHLLVRGKATEGIDRSRWLCRRAAFLCRFTIDAR